MPETKLSPLIGCLSAVSWVTFLAVALSQFYLLLVIMSSVCGECSCECILKADLRAGQ